MNYAMFPPLIIEVRIYMQQKILVITGPTASGKTAFAIQVARALGNGVIINADSMQLYREIPIITAQPDAEERDAALHLLYSVMSAREHGSVAVWLDLVTQAIDTQCAMGNQPILVGGTGMYIRSLMEGISPVPDIRPEIRAEVRAAFDTLGNSAFYAKLQDIDPDMAARLSPGDSQRMMRAVEVMAETGKSLAEWQRIPPTPFYAKERFIGYFLSPPREQIYATCNTRFEQMIETGILDEVKALDAMQLDDSLPAMRAHGVPEIRAYLQGTMTLEQAVSQAQQHTRNYVKRQLTWQRNQLPDFTVLEQPAVDCVLEELKTV